MERDFQPIENFNIDDYEIPVYKPKPSKKSEDKGYLQAGLRKVARAGEAAGGLPGDILSGAFGLGNYATGGAVPTYEKIQEKLPLSLPTSTQTRESLKKVTGGYLEPEEGKDSFLDNVVSDLATFLTPAGSGKAKVGKAALKAAGIKAFGGNIAAKGAEALGAGEQGQALTKLALW